MPPRTAKKEAPYCKECGSPSGHNAICSISIRERNIEIKGLRAALRSLAITERHRMASGGGTIHVGWTCKLCGQDWSKGHPETHRAHCLLATRT